MNIVPVSRPVYDRMNDERAKDGFGPFCGSYEGYLAVVKAHNEQARAAA